MEGGGDRARTWPAQKPQQPGMRRVALGAADWLGGPGHDFTSPSLLPHLSPGDGMVPKVTRPSLRGHSQWPSISECGLGHLEEMGDDQK